MSHTVVTSWSPDQEESYGHLFRSTFNRFWPDCVNLVCVPQDAIDSDARRIRFVDQFSNERTNDRSIESGHLYGAIKWSCKVFALALALPNVRTEWLIWLDADVETVAQVDDMDLARCCPTNADVTYLGRPWLRYSETGFLGFRVTSQHVRPLIENMLSDYTTGTVFERELWGDGAVFDSCRRQNAARQVDLVFSGAPETSHVWDHSPLARFSRHHRGPARKRAAFGRVVS